MLVKHRKGWEIPEALATPEAVFRERRRFLARGAGALALASVPLYPRAAGAEGEGPSAKLYPATRNGRYKLDRALTDEKISTTYNNYYEFGSSKTIWDGAQRLPTRPWEIRIDGLVEKEMTLGIDDLLKQVQLEERLYRHRCVEAWSMAVPWTGFPMRRLVEIANPSSSAKYVKTETFSRPEIAFGMKASWYPWPYVEGVTIEEATNELALIGTGIYGKALPKQMGAPLRLVLPWKYGFKSAKAIVRFTFTDQRPVGFWERIQGREYGFWANVNPDVPHPRWSQATEEIIGTGGHRVPTRLFNGYGEFVADLYKDKQGEKLWM
ncbi:MAG TPA: protein-methionine-sulfoxide reductase catalytic subunit MsrP [Alphaproteobacteria bacterium]|nr:protein-methionine-sulfoxide reductase catalytic subunit MsrP [Alphaproteobacteria bacterium]